MFIFERNLRIMKIRRFIRSVIRYMKLQSKCGKGRIPVIIGLSVLIIYISIYHLLRFRIPLPILITRANPLAHSIIQLILIIPILIISFRQLSGGMKNIQKMQFNANSLMRISIISAILYSLYSIIMIYSGDSSYVDSLMFQFVCVLISLTIVGNRLNQDGRASLPLTDRLSSRYMIAVAIITLCCAAYYTITDKGITFTLSQSALILAISCPSAIVFSPAMTVAMTFKRANQLKVYIKSGAAIELASKVDTIVISGSAISENDICVKKIAVATGYTSEQIASLAAQALGGSTHSAAIAIINYALKNSYKVSDNNPCIYLGDDTFTATIDDDEILIGGREFMTKREVAGLNVLSPISDSATTIMYIAINKEIAGYIALGEKINESSIRLIKTLVANNYRCVMISCRNNIISDEHSILTGVDTFISGVSPSEKQERISAFENAGDTVCMIGCSDDDLPALNSASLGIAAYGAQDSVRTAANIILKEDDLCAVVSALQLAKSAMRILKLNIAIAIISSIIGIIVASMALYPFTGKVLTQGAIAMITLSSAGITTLNTLRILLWNNREL